MNLTLINKNLTQINQALKLSYPDLTYQDLTMAKTLKVQEEFGELIQETMSYLNFRIDKSVTTQEKIEGEWADTFITVLLIANHLNIDIEKSIHNYLDKTYHNTNLAINKFVNNDFKYLIALLRNQNNLHNISTPKQTPSQEIMSHALRTQQIIGEFTKKLLEYLAQVSNASYSTNSLSSKWSLMLFSVIILGLKLNIDHLHAFQNKLRQVEKRFNLVF
jgi:NTP pyrophosphatase (non-canonical NTP hydrolase)